LKFRPSSFRTLAHRPCCCRVGARPLELNQLHGEPEEASTDPVDEGPTPEDYQTELPLMPQPNENWLPSQSLPEAAPILAKPWVRIPNFPALF
jgi:hypothetical protein